MVRMSLEPKTPSLEYDLPFSTPYHTHEYETKRTYRRVSIHLYWKHRVSATNDASIAPSPCATAYINARTLAEHAKNTDFCRYDYV